MHTDESTFQPVADENVTRSLIEHGVRTYDAAIARAEELNRELIAEYEANVALLSILRNEKAQLTSTLAVVR